MTSGHTVLSRTRLNIKRCRLLCRHQIAHLKYIPDNYGEDYPAFVKQAEELAAYVQVLDDAFQNLYEHLQTL